MEKKELLKVNPEYQSNINRWEFYLRSYMGGDQYAGGDYLTRYINETDEEYEKRLSSTPCDNHCKNIVQIYSSFIWRTSPQRTVPEDQVIEDFLKDADLDGRSLNAFMREVMNWASVYGHCWVFVDKPESNAQTLQDEIDLQLRPYLTLVTPDNVLDWQHERTQSGRYRLSMIKVRESVYTDDAGIVHATIRVWTLDNISLYQVDGEKAALIEAVDNINGLIPAVCHYAGRSPVQGVGTSDISDIADLQRAIYNELSEIEQLIRISNHPSLAKTTGTDASAGAGGVIDMPDDLEPSLKPFLLQPSSASLDAIRDSIKDKVETINRISHIGGVRATETQSKSGVALQTEFQLLNTKLSEQADMLELTEEQLWTLFNVWQGKDYDVTVDYPDTFDIRDHTADLEFLQMARASGVQSKTFTNEVDRQIAALIVEDDQLQTVSDEIDQGAVFTEPE